MTTALPRPRVPHAAGRRRSVRQWYEDDLRWPTSPTEPLELLTGVRFDALELPADAGWALLGRMPATGPVALVHGAPRGREGRGGEPGTAGRGDGATMLLLVAAGGAEELPGLLEWLEWGPLAPDLMARGSGDRMPAPPPCGPARPCGPGSREAARWVRPPEPDREVEATLPVTGMGAGPGDLGGGPLTGCKGHTPDLVRLVSAAATECHRARLLRSRNAGNETDRGYGDQPLAFSYASRMSAGTRPRSLTV
ncbi:SCO3374 family protein [Streptomyces sp. NPDC003077]|uniref:SCO3374 family protein n=1 Tax=Streptomyces sp. NPDC003077 TaxID=3154443 RepID=UPI0033B6C27D